MSKHKKRHSASSAAAKNRASEEALADKKDRDRKRMDPTGRNLLLGDLVFLAICQILDDKGLLSSAMSNLTTVLGVILLLAALYFLFVKKGRPGGPTLKE